MIGKVFALMWVGLWYNNGVNAFLLHHVAKCLDARVNLFSFHVYDVFC